MKINQEFIKIRMIKMGIKTKKEFLKRINMHQTTFDKKVIGEKADFKLKELWLISQTLDCEIEDLILHNKDVK